MKATLLLVWASAMFLSGRVAASPPPSGALPRATPESQGVSSPAILRFVDAAERSGLGLDSLMVVRHGHVVAEGWWAPYGPSDPHELYSLSKSFTSTAVGFAVAEGRLSVDDPVARLFPEDAPSIVAGNLAAMRIRDLLTMTTGHQDDSPTAPEVMSPKTFLAHAVPHKPGTHFKYNGAASFMLSAAVQKRTGLSVLEYLRPRLFAPLGIENPSWGTNFQGVSLGGYGLRVKTEDLARFGQLYLQGGTWNGRRILPAAWIAAATSRQVSNGSNPASDWDQGYGFQFWRCRHGAYRGDGAYGQFCIVLPELDAVIAITSGLTDMQAALNRVWDDLLPAFKPGRLRADAPARKALAARLAGLGKPMPMGTAESPNAARLLGRKIVFPPNDQHLEWVSIRRDDDGKGWRVTVRSEGRETGFACGHREWRNGRGMFSTTYPDEPIAACAAWVSDDEFDARICARETPFNRTWRFRIDGTRVTRTIESNLSSKDSRQPPLVGTIE